MKVIWSVMVVAVVLVGCGSDDGGGSGDGTNINNAASLFNNPDGTVSDDNADDAVRKAIDATRLAATASVANALFSFDETVMKR